MSDIKKTVSISLSKGAVHIFVGSLLTRFVSFFASIIVVRVLSKNDYGILSYYENLYNYFFLIAGYGLTNAVLRYVVISKELNEKKSVIIYCQKKGTLFNFILLIIGIIFSFFYKHPEQFDKYKFYLIVMLFFLPFQYVVNLFICNERAFCDNKRYALISFLYSTALVICKFAGALLWQLEGALIIPLFVHLFFSIYLQIKDNQKYYPNIKSFEYPIEKRKEIDWYSIQYMITNGLWTLFALNSTFILGRTIGNAELVADYKIATVLPSFVSILSNSFGIFVAPYFTKHESEKDIKWVKNNWKLVMIVSFILIGITVISISFFAPFAVKLIFGDKYSSSLHIMRLLLIATFFDAGVRYPTANLLAAMNKIKFNMCVSLIGIVTQLFFATFLAYKYGVVGIAISNIIVQCIMAVAINICFIYCFHDKDIK